MLVLTPFGLTSPRWGFYCKGWLNWSLSGWGRIASPDHSLIAFGPTPSSNWASSTIGHVMLLCSTSALTPETASPTWPVCMAFKFCQPLSFVSPPMLPPSLSHASDGRNFADIPSPFHVRLFGILRPFFL